MLNAGTTTFQEFMMAETLPLATVQSAILEYLRHRDDAVVFGAQAVNAYVQEPRMTQGVDILSSHARELAQDLRDYLSNRFHIAVRVRRLREGGAYRLFQIRKEGNRHLADIRFVAALPPARRIADVLVAAPEELIASKVIAYHRRRGQPKSGTDWRDLAMLLLAFPELKRESGPVADRLKAASAPPDVLVVWRKIVAQEIRPPDEEDQY